jgi:hypothetical protein
VIGLSLRALTRLRRAAVAAKDAYYAALCTSVGSGMIGFAAAAMFLSAKHAKLLWFAVFLTACMEPILQQSFRAARDKERADASSQKVVPAVSSPVTTQPDVVEHVPIRVGNWLTRH